MPALLGVDDLAPLATLDDLVHPGDRIQRQAPGPRSGRVTGPGELA
jgi:hypothetical protein